MDCLSETETKTKAIAVANRNARKHIQENCAKRGKTRLSKADWFDLTSDWLAKRSKAFVCFVVVVFYPTTEHTKAQPKVSRKRFLYFTKIALDKKLMPPSRSNIKR